MFIFIVYTYEEYKVRSDEAYGVSMPRWSEHVWAEQFAGFLNSQFLSDPSRYSLDGSDSNSSWQTAREEQERIILMRG
jgi:hypothetical protein